MNLSTPWSFFDNANLPCFNIPNDTEYSRQLLQFKSLVERNNLAWTSFFLMPAVSWLNLATTNLSAYANYK